MHLHLLATLIVLTVSYTEGTIIVRLSESDYAVSEDSSALPVLALIEGTHSENVTLQIIPLTFAMYQAQFPDQPCSQSVEELLGGQNEAESSDFNTAIIERFVGPNSLELSSSHPINVPLVSDNKLEDDEVFLVLLNVRTTEEVTFGRRCAVGRLLGSLDRDEEVIRLKPRFDHIELQEHAGTVFLFNISKIVDTELTISITIDIRNSALRGELIIVPSATLEIAPETSSILVHMTVVDDLIPEDSGTTELQVTASVANTPISQQFRTRVVIHDDEVVALGFVGERERTVVEGSELNICADRMNNTQDFLRFDDEFPLSTADETATAGVDYLALSAVYLPFIGMQCFTLQTVDNDQIEETRTFTVNFASGFPRANLTVIQPNSIRVLLMDNDAPPRAPMINSVLAQNKILTIIWTAEPTPTQPINGFFGNITVEDRVIEFNVTNMIQTHTLEDFQEDKIHVIVVCAENVNGRTCSRPYKVEPPPPMITPGGLTTDTPAKLPPGLIAGIAVFVAALFCCCLLLLFFFLCLYCKVEREKSYWPAKSEGKRIRGRSPDSNYSADEYDDDNYSIESDLHKAPL